MQIPKPETLKPDLVRTGTINGLALVMLCVVLVGLVFSFGWLPDQQHTNSDDVASAVVTQSAQSTNRYPVTINKPAGPPRVDCGIKDEQGNAITVSCATCHATRKPDLQNKQATDLNEFHTGLAFSHGTISCLSCHNENDYDTLKLADGTSVEYTDVMTLCAQCHGPQTIDYQHGAHGGMNGHWDLSRGPRTRNNCVDCHNPHTPQFPKMQPDFKPKDRFLKSDEH